MQLEERWLQRCGRLTGEGGDVIVIIWYGLWLCQSRSLRDRGLQFHRQGGYVAPVKKVKKVMR